MKNIKKAIIPAAGYGTRNLPITKVVPKEMFPINGKPAIHYIVEEAIEAGINEILIVVSRNKNMIMDYYDRSLELEKYLEVTNKSYLLDRLSPPTVHIQYVRQPFAEGLGDAIALGKQFVGNEPFAILLPDDLFICRKKTALAQLLDGYNQYEASMIGLKKVPTELLQNYGVVKGVQMNNSRIYEIHDLVEKPKVGPPSNFAVMGRYILEPTIFSYLETSSRGAGGEIQLTDAIKNMLQDKKCYGMNIVGDRYDIASDKDYVKLLNRMLKER